jgi:Anti-sigma-K factor rskA
MGEDHERIDALLAGYVLLGLTGEDAFEVDRLLSQHVPTCPRCRDTLAGFQAVEGDLGLVARPMAPPELLERRIRRDAVEVRGPRRRSASLVAVAAAVAALVGLAGLSMSLGTRASKAETQRARLMSMVKALQHPGVVPVSVESQKRPAAGMVEISGPGLQRMFLVGEGVPTPARGRVYQLWLGSNGSFVPLVDGSFVPDDGLVLLELTVDTSRYDEILITEEPMDQPRTTPSQDGHIWHAFLANAA